MMFHVNCSRSKLVTRNVERARNRQPRLAVLLAQAEVASRILWHTTHFTRFKIRHGKRFDMPVLMLSHGLPALPSDDNQSTGDRIVTLLDILVLFIVRLWYISSSLLLARLIIRSTINRRVQTLMAFLIQKSSDAETRPSFHINLQDRGSRPWSPVV